MARTDPAAPVIAARQAREVARAGVLDSQTFLAREVLPRPLAKEGELRSWLTVVAGLRENAAENGYPPPSTLPETPWEWRAEYPDLDQFFSCYLGQSTGPRDVGGDAAASGPRDAVSAWLDETDLAEQARVLGRLRRLLLTAPDPARLDGGLTALGLDARPPRAPLAWLGTVADLIERGGGYPTSVEYRVHGGFLRADPEAGSTMTSGAGARR
jgi:hypothetical protein